MSTSQSNRPPAVPLVVNDPYLSVWSMADNLTDEDTKHWTGATQPMCGLIRIDGQTYRFMGADTRFVPVEIPVMEQTSLDVSFTRTTYGFETDNIELELTFLTPALPHKLDWMSRPVTYINTSVKSKDGQEHEVSVYLDITGHWVVDNAAQKVVWGRHHLGDRDVLWMGSQEQAILAKSGDDLRIDWGYLHVTSIQSAQGSLGSTVDLQTSFAQSGRLPETDNTEMPRHIDSRPPHPALAWSYDFGKVSDKNQAWQIVLAYDDGYSVEYMNRKLRPYWRKDGWTATDLIQASIDEYNSIEQTCADHDQELMTDMISTGDETYAYIGALAYRQCLAAHKLVVDHDGTMLFFSKENFSNGCMGTVDVTYPSSPFFLLFNPDIMESMLTFIMDYSSSSRWKFPFAPHDIGRYPLANGQVYGGGEETEHRQMPVEECGNMLIMVTALCKIRDDISYAQQYWDTLTTWADYLLDKGLDPENQLCTDDFAGHLAHNVNLSVKALVGIACYAWLCEQNNLTDRAREIHTQVEGMVNEWLKMADEGDHYRLTFDKPNTWSQKYNLVWDKILGLDLFPDEVFSKELTYYKAKQIKYGLPLDNRDTYTKLDWIVWTASLTESQSDFIDFVRPIYDWLENTESRVPMTDWYYADSGLQVRKMQARSVVGGVFIRLLYEKAIHNKWIDKTR